jgi:thiamine biosynthesis lipoprotein
VLVDRSAGVVQLPVGTTLDPGGLGKGLAADIVTEGLIRDGASGALVEIGGDVRTGGRSPDDAGWTISIDHPLGGDAERVRLMAGGVATSTSRLRTWVTDGRLRHHLIDPRTLRPTDGDVIACTVVAGTGAWAEAFTKVAFVNGLDDAIEQYERRGLAARITTDDGATHRTAAWAAFAA